VIASFLILVLLGVAAVMFWIAWVSAHKVWVK
jgi:hypothetical protein